MGFRYLKEIADGGFDDIFVMVPVSALLTQAEEICRTDGCINFFAGPPVHNLQGSLNLYRVHYDGIHLVGTAGSIPEDTIETIKLIEDGVINPSVMVSHIMGIDSAEKAIYDMKVPNGAKKICYNGINMPMVAIADLEKLGKENPLYGELFAICEKHGGLWNEEAEKYLLENA